MRRLPLAWLCFLYGFRNDDFDWCWTRRRRFTRRGHRFGFVKNISSWTPLTIVMGTPAPAAVAVPISATTVAAAPSSPGFAAPISGGGFCGIPNFGIVEARLVAEAGNFHRCIVPDHIIVKVAAIAATPAAPAALAPLRFAP